MQKRMAGAGRRRKPVPSYRTMWAVPWNSFDGQDNPHPAAINSAWCLYGYDPGRATIKTIKVRVRIERAK